uniref:Uncharacterized protein n=1 Tax=Timema monikensis TaxID=170555 RepID=A0A7R9ELC0_9NEOP|nr:unnamed protein product [Timema monikensis]
MMSHFITGLVIMVANRDHYNPNCTGIHLHQWLSGKEEYQRKCTNRLWKELIQFKAHGQLKYIGHSSTIHTSTC